MYFNGKSWRKVSQNIIKLLNTLPNISKSTIVVALSGGQDSVFLLAALTQLRKKYKYHLLPVYIQHNLIPENTLYCKVAVLCAKELGWKCEVFKINPKPKKENPEEWMRNERYRILENYRKKNGAAYIAVAHHKDDQAETVLAHIIRSCGLNGLSGMSFQRDTLIRPIIGISKTEIELLMRSNRLPYYNDKENYSFDYQRNKIRHELLPYLEKNFNPQIKSHLARLADNARGLTE